MKKQIPAEDKGFRLASLIISISLVFFACPFFIFSYDLIYVFANKLTGAFTPAIKEEASTPIEEQSGLLFSPLVKETVREKKVLKLFNLPYWDRIETKVKRSKEMVSRNSKLPGEATSLFLDIHSTYHLCQQRSIPGNRLARVPYIFNIEIEDGRKAHMFFVSKEKKHFYSRHNSDVLINIAQYLAKTHRDFIYLQLPYKNTYYNLESDSRPRFPLDPPQEEVVELEYLKQYIDILNYRDTWRRRESEGKSLMFNTDHHWTPEGGLLAAQLLAKHLNKKYGYNLDESILDINRYTIKTFPKSFLGSFGRPVGDTFLTPDDFSLIYPNFVTDLSIEIPCKKLKREGVFEDTLLFGDYHNQDIEGVSMQYSVYMKGDFPLVIVKNKLKTQGKRALVIRNSFSCILGAYLSLIFKEIHFIDLRHNSDFNLKEYLEIYNADIVIYAARPNLTFLHESEE